MHTMSPFFSSERSLLVQDLLLKSGRFWSSTGRVRLFSTENHVYTIGNGSSSFFVILLRKFNTNTQQTG